MSLVETVAALHSIGLEVTAVLPRAGPLSERLAAHGARLQFIPYRPWLSRIDHPVWKRVARIPVNLLLVPVALARALILKPDLIITNTAAIPMGALVAGSIHRPHVWLLHEFAGGAHPALSFDMGNRLSFLVLRRSGGRLIANSRSLASHYARLLGVDVSFVYQPVTSAPQEGTESSQTESSPSWPGSAASVKCLLLGSIERNKGQEDAVRAVAYLTQHGVDLSLLIAGPVRGGQLERITALIERLNVGSAVRVVPGFFSAAPLYDAADIVLVCSKREAFGRVAIEAMKAGRPVIGTRTGGIAELIRESETGLLYESGDWRMLAEKIRLLGDAPAERSRLAANAQAWAERVFSAEAYRRDLERIVMRS